MGSAVPWPQDTRGDPKSLWRATAAAADDSPALAAVPRAETGPVRLRYEEKGHLPYGLCQIDLLGHEPLLTLFFHREAGSLGRLTPEAEV